MKRASEKLFRPLAELQRTFAVQMFKVNVIRAESALEREEIIEIFLADQKKNGEVLESDSKKFILSIRKESKIFKSFTSRIHQLRGVSVLDSMQKGDTFETACRQIADANGCSMESISQSFELFKKKDHIIYSWINRNL